MPFGNHFFRCWKKGGHGPVNLHRGIVESCDVFFYSVGRSLGIERIADYSRRLGLGIPTGIAMDHEKSGIIPDTAWKQKRFKQPWYEGETLSVAIGQGYVTATPLQMAHMAATVANGGKRYRPFYVKRVEAPDGSLLRETQPEVMSEAGLKPSTVARLHAAMRDVVMTESGTGKKARVMGVSVGGKTGTSQVVKLGADRERSNKGERETRDHAWFIAFAPTDAPQIAIACIVEHAGGGGGAIAAPVVQQVLQRYFTRDTGPHELPTQEAHAVRPATDLPL
jgi:penicillin-binding protein 2